MDYEETFALITKLETIRMLMAFACFKIFKLYQVDAKNAFVNRYI